MRDISKIIVHCSDSDIKAHDNVETIRKWHVEENGWKDIGYHFLITNDGDVHKCRPVESVGAHTLGENSKSIGICLTGRNDFTHDQIFSLAWLSRDLLDNYEGIEGIYPHRDFSPDRTCPNFNLKVFNLQNG